MLFVEDPTQPPPGLAELDTDAERNSILRWIRDQNLGSCPLVHNGLVQLVFLLSLIAILPHYSIL